MRLTELQDEVRLALKSGASLAQLSDIVRRFKSGGASQRQVYNCLMTIWNEIGDPANVANELSQERLADVLDRVVGDAKFDNIWNTHLSAQDLSDGSEQSGAGQAARD